MANGDFGGALGFNTGRSRVANPFLDQRRKPGGVDPRLSLGAGFLGEADPPFDFPGGPYAHGSLPNVQFTGPSNRVGGNTMAILENLANIFSGIRNQSPGLGGGQTGRTPSYLPDISGAGPKLGKLPGWNTQRTIGTIEDIIDLLGKKGPGLGPPPKTPQPTVRPGWLDQILGVLGDKKVDVGNLGLRLLGMGLQSRALGDYNKRLQERTALMDKLGAEERQRRDFYAQTLMPNLLRGIGYTPEQLGKRLQQMPVRDTERRT